jgi:hypothetical protein
MEALRRSLEGSRPARGRAAKTASAPAKKKKQAAEEKPQRTAARKRKVS